MVNINIETWEQIEKIKTKHLTKQEEVSAILNNKVLLENISIKSLKVLKNIQTKIKQKIENNETIKIDNIYNLICNEDMVRIAYAILSKNKGSMTPGPYNITTDKITEEKIKNITQQLKTCQLKTSPVKRIWIPKPGKTVKRPLGLPDFDSKIIQFLIMFILEIIYEPIFNKVNCNFGFRAKKGCNNAVEHLITGIQGKIYAIEGDIKGAYDNTDHNILLNDINKHVTDTKFIQLINKSLKAGIWEDGKIENSFLGVPQGGIASPILFNIYMHEFDIFVQNLKNKIENQYENQGKNYYVTKDYEKIQSLTKSTNNKIKQIQDETNLHNIKPKIIEEIIETSTIIKNSKEIYFKLENTTILKERSTLSNKRTKNKNILLKNFSEEIQNQIIIDYKNFLNNQLKNLLAEKLNTPFVDTDLVNVKIHYTRYADDWVILVRGNKTKAEEIKNLCKEFLLENRKLTLSEDKTKITNILNDKIKFLGFEIYFQKNKITKKTKEGYTQRFNSLQIQPDSDRIQNRFLLKNYIDKQNKPKEVGFLTILKDHEIITKYNQIMRGLGNYYITIISYPSRINRWLYILYYSCIKTLATKHRLTVKQTINKYGYTDLSIPINNEKKLKATDKRIIAKYEYNGKIKYEILLNYKEIMFELKKLRKTYKEKKNNNIEMNI